MYELVAERPFLLSLILAGIGFACLIGWIQGRSKAGLFFGLFFLALIPLGTLIERRLVTDRERLREIVETMAKAVDSGDYEVVYGFIDSSAGQTLAAVKSELPRYDFSNARITGFRRITLKENSNPLEALVDFTAVATVNAQGYGNSGSVPRRVRLAFRKTGEEWRVIGYEHLPTIGKFDNFSSMGGDMSAWTEND